MEKGEGSQSQWSTRKTTDATKTKGRQTTAEQMKSLSRKIAARWSKWKWLCTLKDCRKLFFDNSGTKSHEIGLWTNNLVVDEFFWNCPKVEQKGVELVTVGKSVSVNCCKRASHKTGQDRQSINTPKMRIEERKPAEKTAGCWDEKVFSSRTRLRKLRRRRRNDLAKRKKNGDQESKDGGVGCDVAGR